MEFGVPLGRFGDCFDRYLMRLSEIRESLKIIEDCINQMPAGQVRIDEKKVAPPSRKAIKTNMEALIHHFKYFSEGFVISYGDTYAAVVYSSLPKVNSGYT